MSKNLCFSAILSLSVVGLSTLGFVSGCRGSSSDRNGGSADGGSGSDGGGASPDAPVGSSTTIYDVQSETTPVGSSVSLRSVVVTGIDTFGGRTGSIYVQESAGGAFSGVLVFVSSSVSASLSVGDLVNVDGGVKDEFALQADSTGRTLTEVSPSDGGTISVTKVGDGVVPSPEIVDPWVLAADDVEAEKWEGVLVTFKGVRALRDARMVGSSDPTLMEMPVTGPFNVGGSLTQLSGKMDDCYSSITGIGDYFFNYKILPRSAADLSKDSSGAACLPPEDSPTLCDDGVDNDHNGFADCADRSCQDAVPACTIDTTVVNAQSGSIVENSRIRVTDVVVTALAADGRSFWVQDEAPAGAYNGLYVFQSSNASALQAEVVPGRKVTVVGRLDEFHGTLTELANPVSITVSSSALVTVKRLDGVALSDLSTDKKYEGVLVSVPAAIVVTGTDPTCTQFCSFTIDNTPLPVFAEDRIFRHTVTANQCYGTFDGIMHFDDFDSTDDSVDNPPGIVILPLEGGLSLGGSQCPQP